MPRVLVTGATGFIGVHLVGRLREMGEEVVCLVRRASRRAAIEPLDVEFVEGDVGDLASLDRAMAGCDVVYHLAGLTTALANEDLHRVNAGGARNVAEQCAAQPTPPVLVYVSSIAAAGPSRLDRPRVERDMPAPVSHYGRSKLAGEQAVRGFAARVPTTIVRPPIVFGEGDRASLPLFMSVQRFGVHMSPLWRPQPFSFVHADDLAAALVAAARLGRRVQPHNDNSVFHIARGNSTPANGDANDNGNGNGRGNTDGAHDGGVYFAAADEIITYAEFGRRIGRALGVARTAVIPNVSPSVWMAALGSEVVARLRGRPMIFNFDKAREAVAGSWACSSAALSLDTGWRPARSLDERLEETARWYRDQGWLPKPGLLARLARR